jgi:hypothetical protein
LLKVAVGRCPQTGAPLASQSTISRLENAPSKTEAGRLSAALLDQFGATVKPGRLEVLDIDDTFCAAYGGQQLAFWNAHHDERGFASMHIYHVASGTPVAAILRPARTPILVIQGRSEQFNSTLDSNMIARAKDSDPEAAESEWGGGFRADITAFLDDQTIEACIDPSRPLELPPRPRTRYRAFIDPSGGRHDHFVLCIGHKTGDNTFVADFECDFVGIIVGTSRDKK